MGGSLTSSKPLEFGAYLNHDPAPEIFNGILTTAQ